MSESKRLFIVALYSILMVLCGVCGVYSSEDTTTVWAPFILPWDDSPIDISFVFKNDKPAGKHGFLTAKGGRFVFEDGTLGRFWGTNFNSGANFPTHEKSEIIAKRLAKFGVNIVRTHQMDAQWSTPNIFQFNRAEYKNDTRSLDPESMDRLDYLIYCLKREGICLYLDLLTYRQFLPGDSVDAVDKLSASAKPYSLFDRKLIELQKEYCKNLWTHYNPYTKLSYKDDPAIVLTEIVNENDPFAYKVLIEPYRSRLESQYRQWAKERKIELGESTVDFTNFTIPLTEFFGKIVKDYIDEMQEYLRSIGVRIPVTGTNWSRNTVVLRSHLGADFTDSHAYWSFPSWVGEGGGTDITPMVSATSNTFSGLSFMRLFDKPFCVSEWDEPWPCEWRAESPLAFASVASFQDWGGVIIHTYRYCTWLPENRLGGGASTIDGTTYRNFFDAFNDPAKFGLFPHSALIFRRGDVSRANKMAVIKIDDKDSSWISLRPNNIPALKVINEKHRTGILLPGQSYNADITVNSNEQYVKDDEGEVLSDTRELWRNWKKRIGWIDTRFTKAAYGFLGKERLIELNGLKLNVKTDFATIVVSSLTEEPIERAKSLLLTAVGRCENSGARFNNKHTKMLDYGKPPFLIEVIEAEIELKTEHPNLRVWVISDKGEAVTKLKTEYIGNKLRFKIGPQPWWNSSTIYYLIKI